MPLLALSFEQRSASPRAEECTAMPSEYPRVVKASYPTAKPAPPRSEVIVPVTPVAEEEVEAPWFTRESLKGWASSLALHALLLLVLAFWYFAPKVVSPKVFDGRLAG